MNKRGKLRGGVSIVEVLVLVVAVMMLASITVPNFVNAQTSSKVARMKNSLRQFNVAVESYRLDHGVPQPTYRATASQTRKFMFARLTTPVSYLPEALPDEFAPISEPQNVGGSLDNLYLIAWGPDHYLRGAANEAQYAAFFQMFPKYSDGQQFLKRDFVFMFSAGPDEQYDILDGQVPRAVHAYDPTNGLISRGEICRFNK